MIEVDVDAAEVLAMLELAHRAISMDHVAEALEDDGPVVDHFRERMQRRFAAEGDAASGKWQPLDPDTESIRRSLGYSPDRINRRSGEMYEWLVSAGGSLTVSGESALLSWPESPPSDVAAKINTAQHGSSKTGAPARPVIAADGEDLLSVLAIMADWVYGFMGVQGYGGGVL